MKEPKKQNIISLIFDYYEAVAQMVKADENGMNYKSVVTRYGKIRIVYFLNSYV